MIERLRNVFGHHARERDPEVAKLAKDANAQKVEVAAVVKSADDVVKAILEDYRRQDEFLSGKVH